MGRTSIQIAQERAGDEAAIRAVTQAAFAGLPHSEQTEAAIVDALRAAGALAVSLVAVDEGKVVGHVAFSPVTIDGGDKGWFGLGPVSVTPKRQRGGIGAQFRIRARTLDANADSRSGCFRSTRWPLHYHQGECRLCHRRRACHSIRSWRRPRHGCPARRSPILSVRRGQQRRFPRWSCPVSPFAPCPSGESYRSAEGGAGSVVAGAGVDCANDAVDQQEVPATRASAIGKARKYGGVKWVIAPHRPDKPDRKMNGAGNHARLRYGAREPGPRFCQRAWTCARVIQFLGNRQFIRQVSGRHPGSRSYRRAGCHWWSSLGP